MVHDLVLALVFLAMIIAPALLAMRSEKEENNFLDSISAGTHLRSRKTHS